jgi:hypothetical protein
MHACTVSALFNDGVSDMSELALGSCLETAHINLG